MAGNKRGGAKAHRTNKEKYGEDFYSRIGAKGGRASRNGGFGSTLKGPDGLTGKERAVVAGAVGGAISKRGKARLYGGY